MSRGEARLRDISNIFKRRGASLWVAKKHLPQIRLHDSALP